MSELPKVDFFVVGVAKCGTSSLFEYLTGHKDVFKPRIKEPGFFLDPSEENRIKYLANYEDNTAGLLAGDFSPQYCNGASSNTTAELIKAAYPNAKVILLTRNPIECAISNWRMKNTGAIKYSFEESVDEVKGNIVRRRCFFNQCLSAYSEHFDDRQILTFPIEELTINFEKTRDVLLNFLGLSKYDEVQKILQKNRTIYRNNRPSKPNVGLDCKRAFANAVREDATAYLESLGLPEDYWDISVGSPAWSSSEFKTKDLIENKTTSGGKGFFKRLLRLR